VRSKADAMASLVQCMAQKQKIRQRHTYKGLAYVRLSACAVGILTVTLRGWCLVRATMRVWVKCEVEGARCEFARW